MVNAELDNSGIELAEGNVILYRNPITGLESRNDIAGGDWPSLDLLKSQIRLTLLGSRSLDLSFESISKFINYHSTTIIYCLGFR